jgi:adenine deaminase
MNLEAAKAGRYGGLPEEEALRFVTLNPARQLGIDGRVGSLEPGKDADFVIWSGHPLSTLSRVEQTWIDGRRYFDREADLAARERLERERAARLAALEPPKKPDPAEPPPAGAATQEVEP